MLARRDAAAEALERVQEGLPLGFVARERRRQPPLALGREPEVCDPPVDRRALPLDEPDLLRAADELGDGALSELQAVGQLRHRRLLRVVGRALDHQQQQVTLRRQPCRARIALRDPQEPAQGGPELGYARDFLG